jgi:hypothetical protein
LHVLELGRAMVAPSLTGYLTRSTWGHLAMLVLLGTEIILFEAYPFAMFSSRINRLYLRLRTVPQTSNSASVANHPSSRNIISRQYPR